MISKDMKRKLEKRSIDYRRGFEHAILAYEKGEEEYEFGRPIWRRVANAYYYYGATRKQADSFERGYKAGWEYMKNLHQGE